MHVAVSSFETHQPCDSGQQPLSADAETEYMPECKDMIEYHSYRRTDVQTDKQTGSQRQTDKQTDRHDDSGTDLHGEGFTSGSLWVSSACLLSNL